MGLHDRTGQHRLESYIYIYIEREREREDGRPPPARKSNPGARDSRLMYSWIGRAVSAVSVRKRQGSFGDPFRGVGHSRSATAAAQWWAEEENKEEDDEEDDEDDDGDCVGGGSQGVEQSGAGHARERRVRE
jgi:hypothetical protein